MTWSLEMSDHEFYYWSVRFRGQFVRAVLAYAGKTWAEGGGDAIARLMEGTATHMPVPFSALAADARRNPAPSATSGLASLKAGAIALGEPADSPLRDL